MKLYVRWEVIKILLHGYDLKMSDNKEASVLHATQQPVQKLGLCPLHVQALLVEADAELERLNNELESTQH